MNKQQALQKQLVKKVIIALCAIGACAGLYFFIDDAASGYVQQKTEAEAALAKDTSDRDQLKTKIDNAKQSEKHYLELLVAHTNPVFEAKKEDFVAFLNDERGSRRFSNLKITLSPETVLKDTAYTSQDYEATLRDDMQLEFDAISDMHVFSFVLDTIKRAPGFIRVKSLVLERKGDLNSTTMNQLAAGVPADSVSAKLVLTWVGVRSKEEALAPATKDAATAPKPGATP